MMNFAHAGEEHVTAVETSAHFFTPIIGITLVMIVAVLILAYAFSRSTAQTVESEEEDS